ncbi:MAG: hypothetical protein N2322_06445 [Terrimicrobiaceae bacterium]|nr:hypothetical protein [Terrimicrobiaceae bacterium]
MLIPQRILDDFKAERKDVTPPLPPALRLGPLLFYLLLGAMIVLGSIYFLQLRMAADRLAALSRSVDQINGETAEVRKQREALEGRILRAQDIERWVASARPLQPLAVAIARSVGEGASIEELKLDRVDQRGPQVVLDLRLGARSMDQLDKTIQAIEGQNFRLFSPQQNVTADQIAYRTTLAFQDPSGQSQAVPETTAPTP